MESKLNTDHNLQLGEDQDLWCALKLNNPVALNSLFNKYYKDLFFYGLKLVGNSDHVADTIQDVFATIWKTRRRISKVTYVKAYIFASFRNKLLKSNSRDLLNKVNSTGSLIQDYGFDISPEDIYLDKESQLESIKIIQDLLADLSPKQKEIIYLKFYCNYSNIEISKILNIKPQSVANLLIRTINFLRKKNKQNNLPIINILISSLI